MTEPAPDSPATDQATAGGEAKVNREDASRAWLLGFTAAHTGTGVDECPYPERTPLAYHWLDGYMAGHR